MQYPLDKQCVVCGVVEDEVRLKAAHPPNVQMLELRVVGLIASANVGGLCQPCKRFLCGGDKPACGCGTSFTPVIGHSRKQIRLSRLFNDNAPGHASPVAGA